MNLSLHFGFYSHVEHEAFVVHPSLCTFKGTNGVARSNLTTYPPGSFLDSHNPLGHDVPTPTVSQSDPTSTTMHSREIDDIERFMTNYILCLGTTDRESELVCESTST